MPASLRFLSLLALATAACGPAQLRYTVRIESEPPGAKIYDPRTDEVVGTTPMDVPIEYQRDSGHTYLRKRTALDQYTPQDPVSREPHMVALGDTDSVHVLVAQEGFERQDQVLEWYFSDADNQVIKKRVYLKPMAVPQGAAEDVYR